MRKKAISIITYLFLTATLILTCTGICAAEDASVFVNKGDEYLKQSQIEEAKQQYEQAWKQTPDLEAVLRTKMGVFLTQKQQWLGAAEQFQKASELNPQNLVIHFNLANVYASMDMIDKGIEEYRKILEIQPNLYWAEFNMSNLYKEQGNLEQAIVHCKNALKINGKLAPVHFSLAGLYEEITLIDEAIEEYKVAIGLDPKFSKAYYNLGVVYLKQHNLDDAFDLFNKAIEVNPGYAEAYINMGAIKMYQKTPEQAIPYFEKGIGLNPPNKGGALVNISVAYRNIKNYDKALEYALQAQKLEYKPADALIRSIEKLKSKKDEK
ncbi:tetratricopeptide repeat protein [uncultured Desulfobacter sp.]|uniref:tetratricopeptide repeat protein n=1 Tax=uncultured Desulfobacter sp. TaxID=240139 RepID=UPI002AABA795|nr:tetratricopeptide repeat protein [uncultured Desulfobacter sp.]